MNKIIFFTILMFVSFILSGCNNNTNPTNLVKKNKNIDLSSATELQLQINKLVRASDPETNPEENSAIRKSLRRSMDPNLVRELIQGLNNTYDQKGETQVSVVIVGIKDDIHTNFLIEEALKKENKPYLQYIFPGLSSIGSQNSLNGIFQIADNYSGEKNIINETEKAFGFMENPQKCELLKNLKLSDYKNETQQLILGIQKKCK